MPWYKNIGQPDWRRPSGEVIPFGEVFEATNREHSRIMRRARYALRVERVPEPAVVVVEEEVVDTSTTSDIGVEGTDTVPDIEEDEDTDVEKEDTVQNTVQDKKDAPNVTKVKKDLPPWPLVMKPELYKRMHPKGPKIKLAEAYVAAGRGGGEAA